MLFACWQEGEHSRKVELVHCEDVDMVLPLDAVNQGMKFSETLGEVLGHREDWGLNPTMGGILLQDLWAEGGLLCPD